MGGGFISPSSRQVLNFCYLSFDACRQFLRGGLLFNNNGSLFSKVFNSDLTFYGIIYGMIFFQNDFLRTQNTNQDHEKSCMYDPLNNGS